jgi:hypothetical protein
MNNASQQTVVQAYANELPLRTERSLSMIQCKKSKQSCETGEATQTHKKITETPNCQLPIFLPSLISDPRSLTPVKLS